MNYHSAFLVVNLYRWLHSPFMAVEPECKMFENSGGCENNNGLQSVFLFVDLTFYFDMLFYW